MASTLARCLEEIELTFVDMGCILDEDDYDYPPMSRCPVCGTMSEWVGCCSADCYVCWTALPDDPRGD